MNLENLKINLKNRKLPFRLKIKINPFFSSNSTDICKTPSKRVKVFIYKYCLITIKSTLKIIPLLTAVGCCIKFHVIL